MLRIATFNIENLGLTETPSLEDRLATLRPIIERIDADILCLQEINAQKENTSRELSVLKLLIQGTQYENYHYSYTLGAANQRLSDKHNLVTLSRYPILNSKQIFHDYIQGPLYLPRTSIPRAKGPLEIKWDRPLLITQVQLPTGEILHVLNIHLKAPLATLVEGQKEHQRWKTIQGWAEGYFLSSIKREGQALEARLAIDDILSTDINAKIVVCGDFNSEEHEAPITIIQATETDISMPNLAPSSMILTGKSLPPDLRYTAIHNGRKQMLDHILISRALYAHYQGCEIHNETIGDDLIDTDQTAGSSHAPVIALFKLLLN